MIRGLYTSASGMLAVLRRMEVLTNNLANVETSGYKQERTTSATFDEQLLSRIAGGRAAPIGPLTLLGGAEGPILDLSQGPLLQTGRELDLALQGPGFFAVQTPEGVRYTRDGSFSRDANGLLTTASGAAVLGENGPLQIPDGPVTVGVDGTLTVSGTVVGRVQLVEFGPDAQLDKVGNNELAPRDGATGQPAAASTVLQGSIESSNVDLTASLTTALELQRAYEASQRMIQSQDELMQRAANDVARPVS